MSLDQDLDTGRFLLSIPLFDGNRQYLEAYELTPEEYELVSQDAAARQALTAKCRAHENDGRLSEPLPAVRGVPCLPDEWRGGALIQTYSSEGGEYRPLQIFMNEQFALEFNQDTEKYCLSIRVFIPSPRSDMATDEKYEVTDEEASQVCNDPDALIHLAAKCQTWNNDGRLLQKVTMPRGSPCHIGTWP